ncbi:MAG: hypothetical protein AMR96_02880 [Candidatus Adiutrix intracellularis]|nr:MAG: hypothetical protein AMR96_02880 [Candidatus Adiutrix intracellularis]
METRLLESSNGVLLAVKKEADGLFDLYFYPGQYNNLANPWAYFKVPGLRFRNSWSAMLPILLAA